MGFARLEEVAFFRFAAALKAAADAGHRIEKTKADKARWDAFVRSHGVPEAAVVAHGRRSSEDAEPVIIDGAGEEWDGFYVYSPTDELCLKYIKPDNAG